MKCFSNNIYSGVDGGIIDRNFIYFFFHKKYFYTHIYVRKIKTFQNTLFLLIIMDKTINLEPIARCLSVMFCLLFLIILQVYFFETNI